MRRSPVPPARVTGTCRRRPVGAKQRHVDPDVLAAAPDPLTAVGDQADVDEWGEPMILPDGRENPNYGRMPHRKILVEPYGMTANLRAEPVEA